MQLALGPPGHQRRNACEASPPSGPAFPSLRGEWHCSGEYSFPPGVCTPGIDQRHFATFKP
eukprot:4696874-Alexandrium_andersonii.AAC.1